jgi:hypothetical protein
VFCIALPLSLIAYREGPLPNMAGGFGDQTCRSCHFDNELNGEGGGVTLTGVPATYTPGKAYTIIVRLERAGMTRGGFELSARFASGPEQGREAGTWRIEGSRLQMVKSQVVPGLEFVQHTTAGTVAATPGSIRWQVEWTAPAASTPVQFNVAANASNDDNSPLGDFIYVADATVSRD